MNKRTGVAAAGLAVGVLMIGGTAFAVSSSIPDGNGIIHGCYDSGGNVKVIDTSVTSACPKGYTTLNWNYQGPQGQKGDAGATGAQGPAGISVGVSGSSSTEVAMLSPAAYEAVTTSPAAPQAGDYYVNASITGLTADPDVLSCGFGENPSVVEASSESER